MDADKDIGILFPKYAFWDVDCDKLDLSRDRNFIISRIFERGKFDDILSFIVIYGNDEAGAILRNNKYLSRKGIFLAHALLGLPLQDFKAYASLKHH